MAIDNKMAHHDIIQSLSPSCDSLPHRSAPPAAAFCGIDLGPKKTPRCAAVIHRDCHRRQALGIVVLITILVLLSIVKPDYYILLSCTLLIYLLLSHMYHISLHVLKTRSYPIIVLEVVMMIMFVMTIIAWQPMFFPWIFHPALSPTSPRLCPLLTGWQSCHDTTHRFRIFVLHLPGYLRQNFDGSQVLLGFGSNSIQKWEYHNGRDLIDLDSTTFGLYLKSYYVYK